MGSTPDTNQARGAHAARTVALVGPAGTGKTSLAEALLLASGAISRVGSIDSGSTVGDASPEARARGGSTAINLSHFTWLGDRYNLIDLPGAAGFTADGYEALQSADLALVVVNPTPERALLVEPILRRLDELNIPHVIVVNRIDTATKGSVHALIAELQPLSREPLVLRQAPLRDGEAVVGYIDLALERAYHYNSGSESKRIDIPAEVLELERNDRGKLLESLADFDDDLFEMLVMEESPETRLVMADLAIDTARNQLVPVVLTSALTGGGIHRLLKLLRHEAPSPNEAATRIGAEDGIHVFKIAHGGAVGRLAYARVYGKTLGEGEDLVVGDEILRCGSLFALQGDKIAKRSSAAVGDVIAISKLDQARAGMVLGRKGGVCSYTPKPDLPARNAALAIAARDHRDDVKLSAALNRLCEEDPTLEWQQDDALHETVLLGVNDDHLAVVLARLQHRYGVAVDTRPPRIAYRETVRRSATQRGRHKKQSGGHGQYGDVIIEIAPRQRGEGLLFEERITGGAIPKQWIPAVEMGVRDAMKEGPLGFPVVDVAVSLIDGSHHSVDSSELAFRIAGRMAMSDALASAEPYLLEPIYRVVVDTPAGTGSRAGTVLSSRRGQILGLSTHPVWERWERLEALLPGASLQGLDPELRSLSQGLAQYSASFDHLAELKGKHADEVVDAYREFARA